MTPRIAILSAWDVPIGFMDNSTPEAIHYYDDVLHLYLAGDAYTFDFKCQTTKATGELLKEGNKLSFQHDGRDYYLSIVQVAISEWETEVSACGLTFELLNEEIGPTDPPSALSFTGYLDKWSFERDRLTIGVNEVSGKTIKNKWEGSETVLKRLFSLANVFGAELSFRARLQESYALDTIVMDIKTRVGTDRTDEIIRYGKEIEGVRKTSDISELYTAIRPTGKDGLTLAGYKGAQEGYPVAGADIRCPSARDRFPAQLDIRNGQLDDGYILRMWDCDVDSQAALYGRALAELKKGSVPKVSYEVDGFVNGEIGDSFTIEDRLYDPPLFLEARVVEQEICFTDPSQNKTTFDNFTEVQSALSGSILSQMAAMVEKNRTYECGIKASNGTIFKNGTGQSTLSAYVRDGASDITGRFTIKWHKDGAQIGAGPTLTIDAAGFADTAVYGFKAFDGSGVQKGAYEITASNVYDGEDGKSSYLHVKYSADGGKTIAPEGGSWRGEYHDQTEADSNDPTKYKWIKVTGEDGKPAQSLKSMTVQYLLSTSDTDAIGTWTDSPPAWDATKYLWTRFKAIYINPPETAYSSPTLDASWRTALESVAKSEAAVKSAQAASTAAASAVAQADQAATKAENAQAALEPIRQGIAEAKAQADKAVTDIATATERVLYDVSQAYQTKTDTATLKGDLEAKIKANATEIQSKVSSATYQQNSEATAERLATLDTALTDAKTSLTTLQGAQSDAAKALSKAQADLLAAQTTVDQLALDQTATQSEVDAAKSALATAQNALTKAQADVSAANQKIGTINGQITGIQGEIGQLTDRMTNAETTITQNSQAIELRATKSEMATTLNDAKKYTDARLKITSEGIFSTVEASYGGAVASNTTEYAVGTSYGTPPTTGWSRTSPAWSEGSYIWQRDVSTTVGGATAISDPVCIQGAKGKDAINIQIDSTAGRTFRNSGISTLMSVTVFVGSEGITDPNALKAKFGSSARLVWWQKMSGQAEYTEVPSTDPRLSSGGFIFVVSPDDVQGDVDFKCAVDA